MKNIDQISVNGEIYNIGPARLKYIARDKIPAFLTTNPTRGELFIDDEGTLCVVDKGDLELYWLRENTPKIREEEKKKIEVKKPYWMIESEYKKMLEDIKLDL